MIIVILKGGIGNQMFQYAFGRYLSILWKTSLFLEKGIYLSGSTNRLFDLDIFPLSPDTKVGSIKDIALSDFQDQNLISERKYSYDEDLVERLERRDEKMINSSKAIILDGYWQSYKYFSPINETINMDFSINSYFKGKFAILFEKIKNTNSVMINVRRGDYLNKMNYHGVVGVDYLSKAMTLITSKVSSPFFYIFSDDIAWCRNNIANESNVFFVDESYYDSKFRSYFILMKSCSHFIIANSTFCWWAAWLANNPSKIVVAPKKWFATSELTSKDLIPDNWIRL